jgi:hypothetical protein
MGRAPFHTAIPPLLVTCAVNQPVQCVSIPRLHPNATIVYSATGRTISDDDDWPGATSDPIFLLNKLPNCNEGTSISPFDIGNILIDSIYIVDCQSLNEYIYYGNIAVMSSYQFACYCDFTIISETSTMIVDWAGNDPDRWSNQLFCNSRQMSVGAPIQYLNNFVCRDKYILNRPMMIPNLSSQLYWIVNRTACGLMHSVMSNYQAPGVAIQPCNVPYINQRIYCVYVTLTTIDFAVVDMPSVNITANVALMNAYCVNQDQVDAPTMDTASPTQRPTLSSVDETPVFALMHYSYDTLLKKPKKYGFDGSRRRLFRGVMRTWQEVLIQVQTSNLGQPIYIGGPGANCNDWKYDQVGYALNVTSGELVPTLCQSLLPSLLVCAN